MKNIKFKKAVLFSVILILLISVFSITCFADTENGIFDYDQSFVFNETILSNFGPSQPLTGSFYYIDSSGNRVDFNEIVFTYRGYVVLQYRKVEFENTVTYVEDVYSDGWLNDSARTVYVSYPIQFTGSNQAFIYLNTSDPVSNYYSEIYNIIIDSVYGDIPLTSDMTLSASIISTVLSILVVLAPVLVGGFIFIWCLKRF